MRLRLSTRNFGRGFVPSNVSINGLVYVIFFKRIVWKLIPTNCGPNLLGTGDFKNNIVSRCSESPKHVLPGN